MGKVSTVSIGGGAFSVYGDRLGFKAYFAASPVWAATAAALTDEQVDQSLVGGTRLVDRESYVSSRVSETQPLAFPRVGLSVDGITIPDTEVPDNVCEASYEIGIRLHQTANQGVETLGGTANGLKRRRRKVDVLETEDEYWNPAANGLPNGRFPDPAQRLLAPFRSSGGVTGEANGADQCSTIEGAEWGFGAPGLE